MTIAPLKILEKPYGVILLNHNGDMGNIKYLTQIWNNATIRLAADGGTNLWYEIHKTDPCFKLPNLVTGDFDSIEPHVLIYVQTESLKNPNDLQVISTPDQDETDFCKAFHILQNHEACPTTVLAIASNQTGRFDQVMANMNTLVKSTLERGGRTEKCQLYLYDHRNIIFPLSPSSSSPDSSVADYSIVTQVLLKPELTCGIIPICGSTKIKTDGLKWNLDGSYYQFGRIVSTSNETVKEVIQVQIDNAVIFTVACSLFNA